MTALKNPRILFAVLAFVALAASAIAEVPQLINYQGQLNDNAGNPVADADYSLVFTIYDNSSTVIWQETHTPVTTSDGLFNVLLGAGDHSGYGNLDESVFSDSIRWLGIKVGDDPEITPRTRLVSVPYTHQSEHAGYADSAGTLTGGDGVITSVVAGRGLTGGGTSGEVTIDVGVGGGLNWGDDFIYIAHDGVDSDNIIDGEVTNADIAPDAVTGDKILDGTITSSDIDNSSVQQRVSGAAATGEYITAINSDGSIVTATDQVGGSGTITSVVAGRGLTGGGTSGEVTIDVGVGGGLNWGDDFIYIAHDGVDSDNILDGTISAVDIDNTSVQQRVTGVAAPGNYITAVNVDGSVVTAVDQTGHAEAGEFDGEVNSDMVETDPGGLTTINFDSPITSTEKPHFYITVVLKGPANGLVEGAAIKAVEDIKGAAGNWTGFDITVSKYSDGTSISDLNKVYVTWMAIGR